MLIDAGVQPSEIGDLTREIVVKVFQHERDDKGGLVAPRPREKKPTTSPARRLRDNLLKHCYPPHLVDDKVREIMAEAAKARQEKVNARQRRKK